MQLERLLQRQGFGTRKGCRALVRQGRVALAGQTCDDPFVEVDTDGLVFSVDGTVWRWQESATVILNKPAGYECSQRPRHHPSVLELLPGPLRERGVQPVGRLDEDTTGLLIVTDDGSLNHRLSSPRQKLPKVYVATTADPLDAIQVEQLDILAARLNDSIRQDALTGLALESLTRVLQGVQDVRVTLS